MGGIRRLSLSTQALRNEAADSQDPKRSQPSNHPSKRTRNIAMNLFNLKSLIAATALSLALFGNAFAAEKVNINTADAATIDRVLVNVGPAKAEAIVAYRKAHGAFRSAEQLAQVDGIGLKTVEKNREMIVLGGGAAPVQPAGAKAPTAAAPKKR
jgi:competence protein ComEA